MYHNPKASLSRGYLFSQEPDENGGHQKNAGKDTCHPIVQYIQWILLSFSINIPPDHELRLPEVPQMVGDGESFPLWAHPSPLFSQRVCGVTTIGGQHAIAMATIGPDLLRWKATPPPLCPPALYRRMALPLNVCQAQQGSSKTSSQEYTVYNLTGKENNRLKKTHSPWSLNMKTMAYGGGTTQEHPFPWEEVFQGRKLWNVF